MPTQKDTLKDRLARYRQIKISIIGRKSGQIISVPGGWPTQARFWLEWGCSWRVAHI
jgi:hypothetical protein